MKSFGQRGWLLVLVFPLLALAQLDTVWLRQFNGGAVGENIFSDMFVDRDGNVYVTGMANTGSAGDIFVAKYDADGNVLWTATYGGRANQDDSASALVVDSLGQVYVCGWVIDTLFDMNMVTLKFSSNGQPLWVKTWSRAFNEDDAAHALCLDQLGRVIVTGYCSDATGNIDFCTICYNGATGDTVWVRYYNRTPENDEDIPYAICVDDSNNVYVTGTSYDDGTDYDIVTARYAPNGVRTWLRRFNNWPWVGDDYGVKVAFDPGTRSVIVGGIVWDDNQDYNYFTIKYRATGESLWARPYNRYPANNEDLLSGLAVDNAGNVFVTGTSLDDVTDYDIATVSYTASGVPRWTQRYDAAGLEDEGTDIRVDSLGQALVLGNIGTRGSGDIAIIKYANEGQFLYSYHWDNPVTRGEDFAYKLFPGAGGNIYTGGVSYTSVNECDFVLLKLYEIGHDFAVLELNVPDSVWINDTLVARAVVGNLSINRDSCWVRLTIAPGGYQDSLWLVLEPGARDTLEFLPFLPDSVGILRVTCWSDLVGDERVFNDTLWADVVIWEESTAVAEGRMDTGLRVVTVMPNPIRNKGVLRISGYPAGITGCKLYDRTGALVQRYDLPAVTGQGVPVQVELDVRGLPAGVYFFQVGDSGRGEIKKLVIQH